MTVPGGLTEQQAGNARARLRHGSVSRQLAELEELRAKAEELEKLKAHVNHVNGVTCVTCVTGDKCLGFLLPVACLRQSSRSGTSRSQLSKRLAWLMSSPSDVAMPGER